MAAVSGSSVGHAVSVLQTAQLLSGLPETEQAFRRGALSEVQAIEVVSAACLAPGFQGDLLSSAECDDLQQLRLNCARVRAGALSDDQRHQRIHRQRRLRHWTDIEGAFRLDGYLAPEAGAVVMAALEPFKQRLARRVARHGVKESSAALAADALVEMAEASRAVPLDAFRPGPGAVVHVRVDQSALERGHTVLGEVCEVPGVGPIPVKAAQAFMTDAFLSAVVAEGEDVKAVAHLGRTVSAKQRTALLERDQGCVVPGCNDRSRLEIDHIHQYSRGGPTSLENLALLCRHHHYLKTYHRYRLKRLGGRWLWESPDGPAPDEDAPQPELVGNHARGAGLEPATY